MPIPETIAETTEYRLILVLPESRRILAIAEVDGYRLPSISILYRGRHARQLQEAVYLIWKLHVLILDFFHGSQPCAVAEVLVSGSTLDLEAVPIGRLKSSELSEEQRALIASLLEDDVCESRPLSSVGWINKAICWLESETGRKLASKWNIKQHNAGGSFALVLFRMENNHDYWLKATGQPNVHERSVTTLLSKVCGDFLPEAISSKPAWNAWLMSGEGRSVRQIPTSPFQLFILLKDAVESMAKLQIKSRGHKIDLLDAGAFDQSLRVLETNAAKLFDCVEEAMNIQISTKVPRLEKGCMQKLRGVFKEVCQRVQDLDICDTILHGDINRGNILRGHAHCQFIDWSEAYIGTPLITLEHLLLLNKVEELEVRNFVNSLLRRRYLSIWTSDCDPASLNAGSVYMPILAAASALYGRGDWLDSPRNDDPNRQSHTRTLARYMDRLAREPSLVEALCQ